MLGTLPGRVPTIDNKICTCRVRAGVTRQVQVDALELPGVRISPQRRQTEPLLLHLERTVAGDGRVNVSRRHRVDPASPLGPFHRQRLRKMDLQGISSCRGLKLASTGKKLTVPALQAL